MAATSRTSADRVRGLADALVFAAPGGTGGAWAGGAAAGRRSRRGTASRPRPRPPCPRRRATAPVKAPWAWPKSSLSSSSALEARAAHRHERPVGPPAPGVDCPGEDPLACAVLAAEQDAASVAATRRPSQDAADLGVLALEIGLGDLVATRPSRSSTRSRSPRTCPTRSMTARTCAGVNGLGR